MNLKKILIGVATGLAGAIVTDMRSWQAARKADPNARFDWKLAASQWLTGCLIGGMTAAGIATSIDPQP